MQKQTIPLHVESTTFHFVWKAQRPPCVDVISSTHLVWEIISVSLKINISTLLYQLKTKDSYIKSRLINEIETNPGPGEKLRIITINCRRLG